MDASLETNLIETDEAAIGSNELDNAIANGMVLDDAGSNEAIATGMVIDNAGFNEAADTCTTCHKTLQNFINLKKQLTVEKEVGEHMDTEGRPVHDGRETDNLRGRKNWKNQNLIVILLANLVKNRVMMREI